MYKDRFVKRWGKIRSKGKNYYIIIKGLLQFDILYILALFVRRYSSYISSNKTFEFISIEFLIYLGFGLTMVSLFVYFVQLTSWDKNEEKYNKYLNH